MTARRIVAAVTTVGLVGAGGVWAGVSASSTSAARTGTGAPRTGLASVVRADLATQQAISGTIGYANPFTVFGPTGTAAQAVVQAQQALAADRAAVGADRIALADTGGSNGQSINQQRAALRYAEAVASSDQTGADQDRAQYVADQHTLDAATAKEAAAQIRLAADTDAQRAAQRAQLADQQQLVGAQSQLAADESTLAAANQQAATDQRGAQADSQALAAAQHTQQADSQAVAHDCGVDPHSSQCAADQAQVALDNQTVNTDQQQVNADQAAGVHDQDTITVDQRALTTHEAAQAALQQRLNGDATTLQEDGFAVGDDQAAVQQDVAAVAADKAAVTVGEVKVTADAIKTSLADPAALNTARSSVTGAQVSALRALHQAQAKLDADTLTMRSEQEASDTAARTQAASGTTVTWLPRPGQVIAQSQPVYAVDGVPVPLLYGHVPLFRDLRVGVSDGPDVGELNADLGLPETERFSTATAAALQRWQAASGLPQTGTLALGEAVVEPGAFRVSAVHASLGATVGAAPILDAASTELVVTAQVPLTDLGSIKAGDTVTIDLPDGRTGVTGRIRDIGAATTPAAGASGQGNSNQGNGQGGNGATTVGATVTFSDSAVAEGLDQAAVVVHVITQTAHGVLAAPIEALLALSDGREGVEVVSGSQRRVVAVTTGLFTGTQVQVDGAGITEGTHVEVPAP